MTDQELKEEYAKFCRAMLEQIELVEGGKLNQTETWFAFDCGLCTNLANYIGFNTLDWKQAVALADYQNLLFGNYYPFNYGSGDRYIDEKNASALYKNEKRLAFLREHAK